MIELRTDCGWKALVHKSLLCHYSTYYEAAIHGSFQEAASDHFNLGTNKDCAEWFLSWLYSGQLEIPELRTETLLHLYVFADEKDILALRRDAMTRLMQLGPIHLSFSDITLAVNSLLPSAPLYKFIVEWYTHHWEKYEVDAQDPAYEFLPKEFLHLVMCGLASRANASLQSGGEPSCACCGHSRRFHEHASYEEWLESKFVCF
jgi:hypothetical protein